MKNTKAGALRRLLGYLWKYKWLTALALCLTLASNIFALLGPMLTGFAIDALEPGPGKVDFQHVFMYCGLMALFYLLSALLSYCLSVLMIHLSQKVVYRMRRDVFNHLMELPVGFFDKLQAGDIISRISYDIDTINSSLSSDVIQICTTIITVVGSLFSMIYLSPQLALVALFTIPATAVFTKKRTWKLHPLFRRRSRKLGELNGFSEEIISGQKTIRAYGREDVMISRFDEKNDAAVDAYYDADFLGSTIGPSVNFISNMSMSIISTGGALLYLLSMVSLGSVSSFILYSRKFCGPINEVANIISELQSALAASERVFNLLDEKPEPEDAPGAEEYDEAEGRVDIEDLVFSYIPGTPVIRGLDLHVKPGELVAIVGHTGAGKTTLINLLMRFYDPDSGSIKLDGRDIRDLSRASLRRNYTMVLQDTWLFTGSIHENIAYGNEQAGREAVVEAAKAAGIHDFIMSLPEAYETRLQDEGSGLSRGQKQLMTIARAMLSRSRILILDEATSNVDTQTERKIQDAMYRLMEGRSCFVIAHRLSTITNADVILVIDDGSIVEQGTHSELLASGGYYAKLYASQFE